VLSAFRTGHEAGWVTIGQGRTVDLSWLTPNGSVRSALVTGVLGMPSDPRVIELLAWAAYLVPMLALMFWPARLRPSHALAQRLRVGGAGVMAVAAVALFVLVSRPSVDVPAHQPVAGGGTAVVAVHGQRATLTEGGHTATLTERAATSAEGADTRWTGAGASGRLPGTLDLRTLMTYTGDRIPVGLSVATAPGPYAARWDDSTELTALTRDGGLVDARQQGRLVLTISGGGLTSPRTFTVDAASWQVDPAAASATTARIADAEATAHDRTLWSRWVPVALLLAAGLLLLRAYRLRTPAAELRAAADHDPAAAPAQAPASKGTITHADSVA
jgi:high-affinity iron transporter